MVCAFKNKMHSFHFRYLRQNGCNDCVRPGNGWYVRYSETLLKFRTLSIVENLKRSFKLGSVTSRVRFRSLFKNFSKFFRYHFTLLSKEEEKELIYYYLFTVLLPFFPHQANANVTH